MDYHAGLTAIPDEAGNLKGVSLRLPAGMALPPNLRAYVMLDVFPLASQEVVK